MKTRYFAATAGAIYLIIGILGFIPGLLTAPSPTDPNVVGGPFFGYLFGLFPVNWIHNLIHLAIGIWGLAAYRTYSSSRTFAKGLAIIYGILAIMGFIPVLRTTFGLAPLWGLDIALHAITALIAAYFGWSHGTVEAEPRERVETRTTTDTGRRY